MNSSLDLRFYLFELHRRKAHGCRYDTKDELLGKSKNMTVKLFKVYDDICLMIYELDNS